MASQHMKVSVALITYNHADYVAQAVQSVLDQQTDFDYEIVIGEDCSTDATPEILSRLRKLHANRIQVEFNQRNLGMVENFSRTLQRCQGEYLALLEGDDFWTSPMKLQRQADFLDGHPDCAVCFHKAEIVDETGGSAAVFRTPAFQKEITTIRDLIKGNYIHTCSVMYRRSGIQAVPEWFRGLKMVDWPFHLLHAERGNIGYLNEAMGAYRVHGGGVFSVRGLIRQHEAALEVYDRLEPLWGTKYSREIAAGRFSFHYALAIARAREGSPRAWEHAAECWHSRPLFSRLWRKSKLIGRLCFPRFYQRLEGAVNHLREAR